MKVVVLAALILIKDRPAVIHLFMLQRTVAMPSSRNQALTSFFATTPNAGRVAVHQLAHGRDGDRAQRRAGDIVDFAQHLPQRLPSGVASAAPPSGSTELASSNSWTTSSSVVRRALPANW